MRPIFKMLSWIVMLFSYSIAGAQNPGSIPGYTLWLQPSKFNDMLVAKKIKNPQEWLFPILILIPYWIFSHKRKKLGENI